MNYKLINFCEFDKNAEQAYCAVHNIEPKLNLGDITKVNEKEIADFNMIVGGSPCQDFSVAGKQKGAEWTCKDCFDEDGNPFSYNPLTVHYTKRDKCPNCNSINIEKTRSSLLVEWLRILREKMPNFGIYENVKNIVGKQFRETFDLFENELKEYGYITYWKVLNAKDYGIPQNRERIYLILIKKELDNGKFEFPKPFDNGIRLKDILEIYVDESFYISQDKVDKMLSQIKNKDSLMYDISQYKREDYLREYNDFSPTLNSRDYKDPRLVNVSAIDKSYNSPKPIEVANCITAREDRGISNRLKEGTAVLENKVKQVGNIMDSGNWDNPQAGRVYDADGCCPTLNTMQGGNRQPKIIQVSNINPSGGGMNGNVYSDEGLSPTLTTNKGEGSKILQKARGFNKGGLHEISPTISSHSWECNNFITEPFVVASRGRNPDNPSDRTTGSPTEQRLEPNFSGYANTITTVQKDCMVAEPQVLRPERTEYGKQIRKAYESGEIQESRHNMTELQPRTDGMCGTLTTVQKDNYLFEPQEFRIRKLTPKECWRLMGFSDEDFNKAKYESREYSEELLRKYPKHKGKRIMEHGERIERISNSQLYKIAGNSIVTNVLFHIYIELYRAMPYLFEDIKLSSFFSGCGAFETALGNFFKYIQENSESREDENFTQPPIPQTNSSSLAV